MAWAIIGYYGLFDLGLAIAVSQYLCVAIGQKDSNGCQAIFNSAFRLQLLFACLAFLTTVAVVGVFPLFCRNPADVPIFRQVIFVLGISAALGFPAKAYAGVLEAELRFDLQSWLAILGVLLRAALMVWAILAGGTLLALAWMTLIATLPVTALQVWFARRVAPWARIKSGAIESESVKNFFSYSIYAFLTYIADILRFQIDPLVISSLIGLVAVTHYRVAGVLAQYFLLMIASVGMLRPVFSRLHGAGDRRRLEEVFLFGTKILFGPQHSCALPLPFGVRPLSLAGWVLITATRISRWWRCRLRFFWMYVRNHQ